MKTSGTLITDARALFVSLALMLVPSLASATESIRFASCYGDHHGSYLNLWSIHGSEGLAQVNLVITNDDDLQEPKIFQVSKLTKDGVEMPLKSWSWVIRQALKAEARDEFYGFVMVTAEGPAGQLYLNLQKYTGRLRHALVINGYVEELTCPMDSIRD